MDLVTAGFASNGTFYQGQATIRLGRGDGSFGDKITYDTNTSTSGDAWSISTVLGDLNGDGILDLVTAGFATNGTSKQGQATVRIGKGDGSFGDKVTYDTETSASGDARSISASLGDLNGDGLLDLITAGYITEGVIKGRGTVFLGSGDGSFGSKVSFDTQTSSSDHALSYAITLGDLNRDGILDLITAGRGNLESYRQGQATVHLGSAREGIAPLLEFSLRTMADAKQAMSLLDNKLHRLSHASGYIAALQSRLFLTADTLSAARDNYATASERIMNADIALETSILIRTQILQQANHAVMAHANLQPSLALQLFEKAPQSASSKSSSTK